uniref:C-type lectin domain-containing protein n=1 Tax=Apteryx owenii TaxID=8824 RepID=A0A8B9SEX7_APTOW
ENMRAKMTQCEADCGKALSDRLRVLGERSPPSAWLTCYFLSTVQKTWQDAKLFCDSYGSHLAIINSEQENKFLANQIMDRQFWLGLTDMHKEGDWQWVDGSPLSLKFWNAGEPNNVGHEGEDCATLYGSGRWNDITCFDTKTWICERSC